MKGCAELPDWFQYILSTIFFSYMWLERWLGKTNRTVAGSVLELIGMWCKKLFLKVPIPTTNDKDKK